MHFIINLNPQSQEITMKSKIKLLKNIIILPYWSKYIGIGILIMCSIAPSVYNINEIDFLSNLRDFIVTIGLLSIILSKEKVEHEMLNKVRFYSLMSSFIVGTIVYQISLLFNMSIYKDINPSNLSAYILVLYIMFFYSSKRQFNR